MAPENIHAHNLLGELYLTQKQPKESLKAFKMVLLLNPNDSRARKIIERLESLTADEYSTDTFQIDTSPALEMIDGEEVQELNYDPNEESTEKSSVEKFETKLEKEKSRSLPQTLTLIDALLVRNEFLKAKRLL